MLERYEDEEATKGVHCAMYKTPPKSRGTTEQKNIDTIST